MSVVPRTFPALRSADYRYLFYNQGLQASAMWMEQVTRNWLTWELTGSALQLGAVNFVRAIPALALSMWGGVLADRFNKKTLLTVLQLWTFSIYGLMAWIVMSSNLQLWHLYVSTLALSLGMSMTQPVRQAYIPATVPQQQLVSALSLNSVAMDGSRFLLPALAGVLIAAANPGWAYVIATFFYVCIHFFTWRIKAVDAPDPERQRRSMVGEFGDGLKFVAKNRTVLSLILTRLGPITIASGFQVLIPVFAVEVLGMGPGAYGALLSIEGAGGILGGLLLASRASVRRQGLVALVAGTAVGGVLLALGFVTWLPLAMVLFFLAGLNQITFLSLINALMFTEVPNNFRGRVVGIRNQTRSLVPVAHLGAGALADVVGVASAFVGVGAASIFVLWAVYAWAPSLRKL